MCYAIPGKVIEIKDHVVTIDYFGRRKRAINELRNLSPGDYVYAQAGYVVQRMLPAEAEEILAGWQVVFLQLQKVDAQLSRRPFRLNNTKLQGILDRTASGIHLHREEALFLLGVEKQEERNLLYKTANFLRKQYHENACCVHGIIEISNHCARNCLYCGISSHNTGLTFFRMSKEEILTAVQEAVDVHGFKALVLQSGEDPGYTIDELAEIIREIRQRHAVLIVISFGEIGEEGLRALFAAGARGLLMRFETSNPELYQELHPGCTLQTRLAHIRAAYDMGYLIFTGGLIGLPGQTSQDIVNDVFLTRELHAEMMSFGPFLPHPQTPLAGKSVPDEQDVLKTLALARLAGDPEAKIVVTTAFETLSPKAREKGLLAGANSVMINVTPAQYRAFYSIYPFRAHEKDSVAAQVEETVALLKSLGRVPMDLGV